jgi:uncharacterized Zn finger protein
VSDLIGLAQRLAGQAAYEKGYALYQSEKVKNLRFNTQNIEAQVQGTQLYQVSLQKVGESFDGGCSCPASEGFDFCKHCVATVLAYATELDKFESMRNGDPADRVKAHIEQMTDENTKSALYKLVTHTPETLEYWVLIADIHSGRLTPKDLKRYFVKALPLKDIWRHDKVRQYFDKAFHTLSGLFDVMVALEPQARFELSEFALQRYDKILERVDDSGGYRFSVFSLLEKQLSKAMKALDWSDECKAKYLVGLYDTDYIHLSFSSIPTKFIDDEDSTLEANFYKELKIAVDDYVKTGEQIKTSKSLVLKQMTKQLIAHYKDNKQVKSALLYSIQIANSMDDYFSIISLSTTVQEFQIAGEYIQIAQSQIRMDEDAVKLNRLALALAKETNDKDAILELAWSLFASTLRIDDFKYLDEVYLQYKRNTKSLVNKAEKALLSKLPRTSKTQITGRVMRAIESLVEFYIYTGENDKALALGKQYDLSNDIVHDIAYASIKNRPKASFNLYRQLSLLYPQLGTQKDFESCIELLQELNNELPNEADWSERFNHLLAELADIFRHKEPFIALLNDAFPKPR